MNLSRRCILGKILTGLFLLKFPGHLSSGSILNQESEQKIRLGYTSFIKELQKSKNLLLQKKLKELILKKSSEKVLISISGMQVLILKRFKSFQMQ